MSRASLVLLFFLLLSIANDLFGSTCCYLAGDGQNALSFDGIDDRVEAPLPELFADSFDHDFTMEAWIHPIDLAVGPIFTVWKDEFNYVILYYFSGGLLADVHINGEDLSMEVFQNVPLQQWTHVAVRFQETSNHVDIFINGEIADSQITPASSTGYFEGIMLGGHPYGSLKFKGEMDEFRIWVEHENHYFMKRFIKL